MSDNIQMRTTTEQSGDYRVFAAKGDTPIKGLAIHNDVLARLDGEADYIEVEVSEGEGALTLTAFGATTATVKVRTNPAENVAVRGGYVEPAYLQQFDSDFTFNGQETDLESVPTLSITGITLSDEDTYDESQSSSAEDAADALFGDSDESDEAEAESDEEEAEEEAEVLSDDEVDGLIN